MKRLTYISIVLSLSAIMISLSNLSVSEYPFASLFITILGILVTLLVGWQIYNAFTVHSEIRTFRKEFDEIENKLSTRLSEDEEAIIKRCDEAVLAMRNAVYRNIEALGACIALRMNHGAGVFLDFVVDNINAENDYGGFLCHMLAEAAEGCVSDIVSSFCRDGNDTMLRECIDALPHGKFCRLYSIDFKTAGWDNRRVAQFKYWLDIIASKYPKPHIPSQEEIQRQDELEEQQSKANK